MTAKLIGKAMALVLGAAMLLNTTGCATATDQQKTVGQGAAGGAILGAVIGTIVGHQFGDRTSGALIGAAIGGLGGAAYGNHVAGKKKQFASQEDYLNACLAQANKEYSEALAYNDKLGQQVEQLDARVTELAGLVGDQERLQREAPALKRELAAQKQATDARIAQVNKEIQIQREVLATERNAGAGAQLAALDQKIRDLETVRNQLAEGSRQLASSSSRMTM
jgi:uncharacterized protein YcfJ